MGITALGARRKLMAALQPQAQYKVMNERLEELEAENARLLGAQAHDLKTTTHARNDAENARMALRGVRSELLVERAQVNTRI